MASNQSLRYLLKALGGFVVSTTFRKLPRKYLRLKPANLKNSGGFVEYERCRSGVSWVSKKRLVLLMYSRLPLVAWIKSTLPKSCASGLQSTKCCVTCDTFEKVTFNSTCNSLYTMILDDHVTLEMRDCRSLVHQCH